MKVLLILCATASLTVIKAEIEDQRTPTASVSHLTVTVSNLTASIQFYTQVGEGGETL